MQVLICLRAMKTAEINLRSAECFNHDEKEFDKIRSALAKAQELTQLSSSASSLKSHGKLFGMDALAA